MPISRPSIVHCPLSACLFSLGSRTLYSTLSIQHSKFPLSLESCPLLLFLSLILFLPACSFIPSGLQVPNISRPSPEFLQTRLLDVSYPLLTAAAEWCPFDQERTYGFLLRDDAKGEGQDRLPWQGRAVVAYVHPRLPSAHAGLSVDDTVMTVNTVSVAGESASEVGRLIGRLTKAKIQPLLLEVMRGGEVRTVVVASIPACHYATQVLDTDLINGITDGRRIGVTRGALQFFSSDDELGWVVAHEIAHNILSHSRNIELHVMVRALLTVKGQESISEDILTPRPSSEVQADYVGAYLMARAGYDLSAIKRVWEQLERIETTQGRQKPLLAETHPPTKERIAAFEVTLREIEAKQKAGEPLDFSIDEAR